MLASIFWWRALSSPWLFFVGATLALFGIQTIITFFFEYGLQFYGGYFLEANEQIAGKVLSEADVQQALEKKGRTALIQASILLCAAVPFLLWLKSGLSTK